MHSAASENVQSWESLILMLKYFTLLYIFGFQDCWISVYEGPSSDWNYILKLILRELYLCMKIK